MESIKHKMDTLISEKLEAEQRTIQLRNEKEKFDAETVRVEREYVEGDFCNIKFSLKRKSLRAKRKFKLWKMSLTKVRKKTVFNNSAAMFID